MFVDVTNVEYDCMSTGDFYLVRANIKCSFIHCLEIFPNYLHGILCVQWCKFVQNLK